MIKYSEFTQTIKERTNCEFGDSLVDGNSIIKQLSEQAVINAANIDTTIQEYDSVAPTDILKEYVELSSTKESAVLYKLNDSNIVAINEESTALLDTINNKDILSYMQESKSNFMQVIKELSRNNNGN